MTAIVLFDGECNFCDSSVQFIIKRDPDGFFQFAALQSEIGEELKKKHQIPDQLDSIIVIDNIRFMIPRMLLFSSVNI